jgi:hypothetical protein
MAITDKAQHRSVNFMVLQSILLQVTAADVAALTQMIEQVIQDLQEAVLVI